MYVVLVRRRVSFRRNRFGQPAQMFVDMGRDSTDFVNRLHGTITVIKVHATDAIERIDRLSSNKALIGDLAAKWRIGSRLYRSRWPIPIRI